MNRFISFADVFSSRTNIEGCAMVSMYKLSKHGFQPKPTNWQREAISAVVQWQWQRRRRVNISMLEGEGFEAQRKKQNMPPTDDPRSNYQMDADHAR